MLAIESVRGLGFWFDASEGVLCVAQSLLHGLCKVMS